MTIESTKKIIASIILAIMLLAVTTPTFAATTKRYDFGNVMGSLTKVATGAFGIIKDVTPEIGKVATNAISKVDTSKIKESLGGITSNIGKNDNNKNNNNNGFKESITGIVTNLGTSISNTFNGLFKNEDKPAEDNKQINIINIFGQKDEKQGEKVDTQKTTGILDIFKNMFNKDETAKQDKEIGKVEETVNKVKEETTTFFENIGQKGLFGGIITYISNKKVENSVGVDGVETDLAEENTKNNVTILGFFNKLKENLVIKKDDEKPEEIVTTEPVNKPVTTQKNDENPEKIVTTEPVNKPVTTQKNDENPEEIVTTEPVNKPVTIQKNNATTKNTMNSTTKSKAVSFISNFEGNQTYTKNGVKCYKASMDTDGKMKCVGVSVAGLTPVANGYYAVKDVDKRVESAVDRSANIVIDKANEKGVELDQEDVVALTSFTYQCAGNNNSNIDKVLDTYATEGKEAAAERMLLYNKAGNTTLGGVVKRRNAEATLMVEGEYNGNYNDDTRSDLNYYKKVTESEYEFNYSGGANQKSNYQTALNKV